MCLCTDLLTCIENIKSKLENNEYESLIQLVVQSHQGCTKGPELLGMPGTRDGYEAFHQERVDLLVARRNSLRDIPHQQTELDIEINEELRNIERNVLAEYERNVQLFKYLTNSNGKKCRCEDLFDIMDDLKERFTSNEYKEIVELIAESHKSCKTKRKYVLTESSSALRERQINVNRGSETPSDNRVNHLSRFTDALSFWQTPRS